MNENQIPSRLYRYRSISSNFFEEELRAVVERQEQYFSSVSTQNDPFDCNPKFVASSNLELFQIYKRIGKKHLVPIEVLKEYYPTLNRKELRRMHKKDYAVSLSKMAKSNATLERFIDEIRSDSRIICLSESWNNPLLWAHYGAGHNGIVLGFEPDVNTAIQAYEDVPLKVRYVERRPTLKTTDLVCWLESDKITDATLTRKGDKAFDAFVLTKPKVWEYEEEWRVQSRFKGGNAYKTVPSLVLREVIVGMRVGSEGLSVVEKICGDKLPVLRVGMDKENFELKLQQAF